MPVLDNIGLNLTPVQLAQMFGLGEVAEFVGTVAGIIDVINNIPIIDGNVFIPLGSFTLGDEEDEERTDLRTEDPTENDVNITEQKNADEEIQNADEQAFDFFQALDDIGLELPILEQPATIFKLLLGQDVDFFRWDIPDLEVSFPFPLWKFGPIIPPYPIFVSLSGMVGAGIDLKFGFDSHGLRVYEETDNPLDIFSGFYISDREMADGTGRDVPEAFLRANVNAGVEVSIGVLSAGVAGGITSTVGIDLVDPNNDGKVHLDEFLDNIELDVTCTFDLVGGVEVELSAYIEFLLTRFDVTIPPSPIQIFEFRLTNEMCYPDRFTGNDSMSQATNLGVAPGLHVEGMSLETATDEDWYKFELVRPDSVTVDVQHSNARGNIDVEVFNAAGQRIEKANSNRDHESVDVNDLDAGEYFIRVFGEGLLNNYKLEVLPSEQSDTRVIYVNGSSLALENRYYTSEPGDDAFDGLTPRQPKRSLQSVVDSYELGPNDIVVLDAGVHAVGNAILSSNDNGALFVGAVEETVMKGITLQDSDDNHFYQLEFDSPSPNITLANSDGNRFEQISLRSTSDNAALSNSHRNQFSNVTFESDASNVVLNSSNLNEFFSGEFIAGSTNIRLDASHLNRIDQNEFSGEERTRRGAFSRGGDRDSQDNQILRNTFREHKVGVYMASQKDNFVADNNFIDNWRSRHPSSNAMLAGQSRETTSVDETSACRSTARSPISTVTTSMTTRSESKRSAESLVLITQHRSGTMPEKGRTKFIPMMSASQFRLVPLVPTFASTKSSTIRSALMRMRIAHQ